MGSRRSRSRARRARRRCARRRSSMWSSDHVERRVDDDLAVGRVIAVSKHDRRRGRRSRGSASSCSSVRLRGNRRERVHAAVCETTSGASESRATSRKPASFRCARSSITPSSLQARTSSRPAARETGPRVRRARDSGTGRRRPKAFGRLQTIPSERSPRSYQPRGCRGPASIGSAPSRWRIAPGLLAGEAALELGDRPHERQVALDDRGQLVGDRAPRARTAAAARAAPRSRRRCARRTRAESGGSSSVAGTKIAKKPAAIPPSRIRGRSRLPVVAALPQRAAVPPDAQQRVVVAVDDRDHASSPGSSEYIAQSTAGAEPRVPVRAAQHALEPEAGLLRHAARRDVLDVRAQLERGRRRRGRAPSAR